MDPNYKPIGPPAQPEQPSQPENPYGFILDTKHQPKGKLSPNHNSVRSRLLIALGGGLVIIIAIIIGYSLIFGGKESNAQLLTDLAAEQTEIVRISDLGLKSATDHATLGYAETTKLTVTTHLNKLTVYLKGKNVKIAPLTLNAKLNKNTDAAFTAAVASNRFEDVFNATLKQSLASYALDVKKNYDIASNPASKALLADSYNSTTLLLK